MAKIIKTYESFVLNRSFKYEDEIIDPILILIRDNQEYLTQPENLPQLAKLGYMYNTLWYAGRVCWGYSGILRGGVKPIKVDEDGEEYEAGDCEDNPKYKIEMCDPHDEEIENLIYDAWGMHISDDDKNSITFDKFYNIIKNGKELTEFEKSERKPNKTFDEWVSILTDKRFRYSSLYPDRRSVANHLLCVIGNGYGFSKDGFVIKEASGADQDEDIYGEWENAKFSPQIESVVDGLINMPELRETMNAYSNWKLDILNKEKEKKRKQNSMFYSILKSKGLYKDEEGDLDFDEIHDRLEKIDAGDGKNMFGNRKDKYHAYYPISSSSIIHTICDEESRKREGILKVDQSYIEASKEICFDILKHEKEENKSGRDNVDYAKKFLAYLGVEGFTIEKGHDKYELLADIKEYLYYITDGLPEVKVVNQSMYGKDGYYINLRDTAKDSYGDNNYYVTINFGPSNATKLPKGISNDVEFIKTSPYYEELKSALDRIESRKEVKQVLFYFKNTDYASIYIEIHTNPKTYKYAQEKLASEEVLKKMGFSLDNHTLELTLEKLGLVLSVYKPTPFGSAHPDNKPGSGYYGTSGPLTVFDKNRRKLAEFNIDERRYNTISGSVHGNSNQKLSDWIISEFGKMKLSNPAYGTYDNVKRNDRDEGKVYLYRHDFMLWLKEHQNEFK